MLVKYIDDNENIEMENIKNQINDWTLEQIIYT